ncbi:hypothetical protein OC842_007382 [Tilletia horrida]|uniref:Uncharacterized protein n=1 Tax=Tilletia horrida TaxID=155126 RepID=A0AAN6G6E8_9BASI|nr:hypothetical protein OC842_007382 [Tilletia horrida]
MPPKEKERVDDLEAAQRQLESDMSTIQSTLDGHSHDISALRTQGDGMMAKLDQILKILQLHSFPSSSSAAHASADSTTKPTTGSARDGDARDSRSTTDGDSNRSFLIKPEELGTFDGIPEDTTLFLAHVQAIRATETDPAWARALLRAIPRTFRGAARLWFALMTDAERTNTLSSLDNLIATVEATFKPSTAVIRRQARERHWLPETEDLVHFSFVKAALLKMGWSSLTEGDLVQEIVDDLDPAVAKLLQTPYRSAPTLTALRMELRAQEAFWRLEHNRPLARSQGTTAAPTYGQLLPPGSGSTAPAAAYPQLPTTNGRPRRSIRDDFDPRNLAYKLHPETGKRMMTYKIPSTNRTMWCARPCNTCAGDHFDFAHDHCSKNTVAFVNNIDADEGYPCTMDADEDDDDGRQGF